MKFLIHQGRIWQPVHVKPRCEKKFESYCSQIGVGVYVPLKVHMNTIRGKVMRSMVPMFPGYVFASLDQNVRDRLNLCGLIVRYIYVTRETELSLIKDLNSIVVIEKLQSMDHTLMVEPQLISGSEISVKRGALRGLTGVIERRKGIHRIIVNVEIINQSVTMEIDACDVELHV